MWHRLPYEQKRVEVSPDAPDGHSGSRYGSRPGECPGRARGVRRQCRSRPGSRRSGRERDDDAVRLGQRVRLATRARAGFRDRRAARHQRAVPRVRRTAGGYRNRESVGRRRLGMDPGGARSSIPAFWLPRRRRVALASACSRTSPLPPTWLALAQACLKLCLCRWTCAGLCRPGRSHRAYARWKGRRVMSAKPSGNAPRKEATRGHFDFAGFDPVAGGLASRRARARGACTIWSATAGSGPRRCSRRSTGFAPMRVVPEYSADFFDGRHYVMKGASPATARELDAPELPQLVPRQLSLRLREVPTDGAA